MNVNIDIEPRAENVFAEKLVRARFFDRVFENLRAVGKFASDVDVGCVRVDRETGNQNPFEELMWVFLDDVTVLERARLRFVRVANQIDWLLLFRLYQTPFY